MSDPHFTHDGFVQMHDPRARLSAAIGHINRYYSDAHFCVISGDLVDRGTRVDYAALLDQLNILKIPFLPMAGNHDDRALLRATLPLPITCMKNYIQYDVATHDVLILCLDTQKTGSDAGGFCEERHIWLRKKLQDAGNTPVYLFMHHPPMDLGLPMQDTDKMENGDAFLDLLTEFDCVKYLFIGHVHRPVVGTVRGIPFASMRSILYQAPAPKPDWNWNTFKPSEEAPNFGVLTIEDSSVNLQYVQFCDYSHGTAG